jgi:hypothetical protein
MLAGALMIIMSLKALDSSRGFMDYERILWENINCGFALMGVDPSTIPSHKGYYEMLKPAIDTLYERFAIVEYIMNS